MKGRGLTEEQIQEIKRLHRAGVNNVDIADKLEVHTKTVERVINPIERMAADKKFTEDMCRRWDATRLRLLGKNTIPINTLIYTANGHHGIVFADSKEEAKKRVEERLNGLEYAINVEVRWAKINMSGDPFQDALEVYCEEQGAVK